MNKPSLFVGLDGSESNTQADVIPFIETKPLELDSFHIKHQFEDLDEYTHILFTSKNGVKYFFEALDHFQIDPSILHGKISICIGQSTKKALESFGIKKILTPRESTQEGLIEMLAMMDVKHSYFLLPRSNLSRKTLVNALKRWRIRMQVCDLYTTVSKIPSPLPDLSKYNEIIFSSPSSVDSFKKIFPRIPRDLKYTAIGPVTKKYLFENLHK